MVNTQKINQCYCEWQIENLRTVECQNPILNFKYQVDRNIQNTLPQKAVVNEMFLGPRSSIWICVWHYFLYMIIISLSFTYLHKTLIHTPLPVNINADHFGIPVRLKKVTRTSDCSHQNSLNIACSPSAWAVHFLPPLICSLSFSLMSLSSLLIILTCGF